MKTRRKSKKRFKNKIKTRGPEYTDLNKINRIRKAVGLRELVQIEKNCLDCGERFFALSPCNNFLCDECRYQLDGGANG